METRNGTALQLAGAAGWLAGQSTHCHFFE